jgi:hypothetical protein
MGCRYIIKKWIVIRIRKKGVAYIPLTTKNGITPVGVQNIRKKGDVNPAGYRSTRNETHENSPFPVPPR